MLFDGVLWWNTCIWLANANSTLYCPNSDASDAFVALPQKNVTMPSLNKYAKCIPVPMARDLNLCHYDSNISSHLSRSSFQSGFSCIRLHSVWKYCRSVFQTNKSTLSGDRPVFFPALFRCIQLAVERTNNMEDLIKVFFEHARLDLLLANKL